MANREFLMHFGTWESGSYKGWLWSEKLDGQRCFWDGGRSRGLPKKEVPWANNQKDERYKVAPVATGLWSRYGNVIHAPDWFLDELPQDVILDGELWKARKCFQETRSIISQLKPDERWRDVTYRVFDRPSTFQFCASGQINKGNNWKEFQFPHRTAMAWLGETRMFRAADLNEELSRYCNGVV